MPLITLSIPIERGKATMERSTEDIKKQNLFAKCSGVAFKLSEPLFNQWFSFICSLYVYTREWSKTLQYSLDDTMTFLLTITAFLSVSILIWNIISLIYLFIS